MEGGTTTGKDDFDELKLRNNQSLKSNFDAGGKYQRDLNHG